VLAVVLAGLAAFAAAHASFGRAGEGRSGRVWATGVYAAVAALAAWLSFGPSIAGPYSTLVALVPGFDGLRVPARFTVILSLAIAALAGGGAAWLTGRLRPAAATILAFGLCASIVGEGYGGRMRLAPFDPGQAQRRELNAWLRAAPAGGLVELPIAGPAFEPFTVAYQYNTLFHGHPTVNGYTGTGFALQDFLGGVGTPLGLESEIAPMLRGLRHVGVRYVVLHLPLYERRHGVELTRMLERAVDAADDQVAARVRLGDTIAWRLGDAIPADGRGEVAGSPVAVRDLRVDASTSPEAAPMATDGRIDTNWSSGSGQSGGEWFRLEFGRKVNVSAILLKTGRTGHIDRPRWLIVEGEDVSGSRGVLFDDSVLPAMVVAIARRGILAPSVLPLPPNRSRALMLRQTGQAPKWHWSIYELEVRERALSGKD